METKLIKINTLRTAEYNPRKISDEKFELLKTSITEDPEFLKVRPIIVNTHKGRENVVIGGNMRLKAAKALGLKEIEAILVDVPQKKEKLWNLKDNIGYGEWHNPLLKDLLLDLKDEEIILEDIGFSQDELTSIFDEQLESPQNDFSEDFYQNHDVIVNCKNDRERTLLVKKLNEMGYKYTLL